MPIDVIDDVAGREDPVDRCARGAVEGPDVALRVEVERVTEQRGVWGVADLEGLFLEESAGEEEEGIVCGVWV